MAPAIRENGIKFRVYPNDHNPPHVHIEADGGEYIIRLDINEFWGDKPDKARKIMRAYWKHRSKLVEQWNNYERQRKEWL